MGAELEKGRNLSAKTIKPLGSNLKRAEISGNRLP